MKGDDSRVGRRRFVGMAALGVAALASGCQLPPPPNGYKNCKAIIHIGVTDRPAPGYWEHFGYSDDGTIVAGTDYALNLGETFPIAGGEITDH